ncbi:MAG: nucleotidyltransferase domain-containing protein [Chloroflexi bacterium]|nr:nucleotidyltransferase domain-containing protein [Chloroflexota bacterium]
MPTKIKRQIELSQTSTQRLRAPARTKQQIDPRVRRALLRLKRSLQEIYGARFRGLYLYGSYARGDARPDSDVDTVIALAGKVQPFRELDRLSQTLSDLCLQSDLLIATYPIPATWLRKRASPLFENIRREGVLL